jgi:hypothetical protein
LRERLGRAGQARVKEKYLWEQHVRQMDAVYRQVVEEQRVKAQLKKKTLGIILVPKGILLAIGIFLLIGAAQFFTISQLKKDASEIVNDTLPSLSNAGEANASLAQAFNRTWNYVMTDDPAQRPALRREAELFSRATTSYLDSYKKYVFEKEEQKLLDTLLARRAEYLKRREQTFALMDSNKRVEAVAFCKNDLRDAYHSYRQAGYDLFDYNMRQGQARGRSIMAVCTLTQFVVAGMGIVVFIAGFLIGMSK